MSISKQGGELITLWNGKAKNNNASAEVSFTDPDWLSLSLSEDDIQHHHNPRNSCTNLCNTWFCKELIGGVGVILPPRADVPASFSTMAIESALGQFLLFAYCCDYIFVQSAKSHGADVQEYEEFSSVTNNVYLPMNQFFVRTMSSIQKESI